MRINTKCSIALHCLIFIFEYEDKTKVTSALLAKSTGCNPAAIRGILNALQKAHIISIVRGVGGAHLACTPQNLTMWDVYHALEPNGLEDFIGCHPNPSAICPVGKNIKSVLDTSYSEISMTVQNKMKEITLQQLLDNYHKHNAEQTEPDYEK